MIRSTAYLLFKVSTRTGQIIGVGIYSERSPTRDQGFFWLSPPGMSSLSAPTYHEAHEGLREAVGQSLDWWGQPGSPLRRALEQLAEDGFDAAIVAAE